MTGLRLQAAAAQSESQLLSDAGASLLQPFELDEGCTPALSELPPMLDISLADNDIDMDGLDDNDEPLEWETERAALREEVSKLTQSLEERASALDAVREELRNVKEGVSLVCLESAPWILYSFTTFAGCGLTRKFK